MMDVRPIDANALKPRCFRSREFNCDTGSFDLPVVPWHDIEDVDTLDYVPRQQWISVKDRLPEDDKNLRFYDDGQLCFVSVLVHDENRGTAIANRLMIRHHSMPVFDELATDGWVWSRPYEPTHWMPLPEQPKEG